MTFFYVYLLITKKKNKYVSYVGYTNNLNKRVKLHNLSKGAKFTRGNIWKLAYFKKYMNKSLAMSEEYKLKKNYNLRRLIKIKFLRNENINSSTL
jgi:putative endonuclease